MNYNQEDTLNYYKEIYAIRADLMQRVADEKYMEQGSVEHEKHSTQNRKLMERTLQLDHKMSDAFLGLPENSGYITNIATLHVYCPSYLDHTLMKNFLESKGFPSNEYSMSGNRAFYTTVGSDSTEGLDKIIKEVEDYATSYYLKAKVQDYQSKDEALNAMMSCKSPILLGSKVGEIVNFPLNENSLNGHSFSNMSKIMRNHKSLYEIKEFEYQIQKPDPSKLKLGIVEILKKMPKVFDDSDRVSIKERELKNLRNELHEKTGVDEKIDYNQYKTDGRTASRANAIEMEFARFKQLIETTPEIERVEKVVKPSAIKNFLLGIKESVENTVDGAKDILKKGGEMNELKEKIIKEQEEIFRFTGINIEIDVTQHLVGQKTLEKGVECHRLELERFKKITAELYRLPNIIEEVCEQGLSTEPERVEQKAAILRKNGVKM